VLRCPCVCLSAQDEGGGGLDLRAEIEARRAAKAHRHDSYDRGSRHSSGRVGGLRSLSRRSASKAHSPQQAPAWIPGTVCICLCRARAWIPGTVCILGLRHWLREVQGAAVAGQRPIGLAA
jgi:hypothetical protein